MSASPLEHPVDIQPVTADRWPDLEKLFGPHGAHAGCWCMFWRAPRAEFTKIEGEGARAALKGLTESGRVPGLLAYVDGQPVGWCSLGPRQEFAALERSRVFKRVDDTPVWSIVCFFIARPFRRKGMMVRLLQGAVRYAAGRGAQVVEGYPMDLDSPKLAGKTLSGCSGYMGIVSAFRAAGFVAVGQASDTKQVMRYMVKPEDRQPPRR